MYPSERFETTLLTEIGMPFKGVIQPVQDAKIYPDDFFYHRSILRTRIGMPVSAGEIILDPAMRRFLLGELDIGLTNDTPTYVSFQMYPCTGQVVWQGEVSELDPLTDLPRSTGMVTLGTPWVLMETLVRDMSSANIKSREETKRVLTGAAVELNHTIDGMTVTKVNITHGLRVLEVI